MANVGSKMFVLFFLFSFCKALNGFDEFLPDVEKCESSCGLSYAPHTYPNGSDYDACLRGCRFYTITNLSQNFGTDLDIIKEDGVSATTQMCYNSCIESYNQTSTLTAACKVGCNAQELAQNQQKMEDEEKVEDDGINIHLLRPIMQVREVLSSMEGAFHVVRTSLLTYFIQDDNTLLTVESEPQVMIEIIPDALPDIEARELSAEERADFMNNKDAYLQQPTTKYIGNLRDYPRLLLMVTVIPFLLFVAFYTAGMVYTRRVGRKVVDDKIGQIIIKHNAKPLPIKLVRPEDLTKLSLMEDDDTQAQPLPTKMKLPDSTV